MAEPIIVECGTREAWLGERGKGLGASEVASVLGISKWATPLDVYLVKRGLVVVPDNPAMQRGRRFEPTAGEMYEELAGEALIVPPPHALYRHATEPWATCTPDRFAQDGRIVELKTANWSQAHRWGESGTTEVPDEYFVQVVWQMFVCDRDVATIAALLFLREPELRTYTFERDRELERRIVEQARAFWFDHVVAGVPPEMSGGDAASAWIAQRFPKEQTAKLVEASPEVAAAMAKLRDVRETVATLKEEDDRLANVIKEAIGEHAGVTAPGVGTIAWKWGKGSTRWKGLAEALVPRDVLTAALPLHQGEGSRKLTPRWEPRESGDDPAPTSEG